MFFRIGPRFVAVIVAILASTAMGIAATAATVVAPHPCGTVHWPNGRETAFCVGTDNHIYMNEQVTPGGPWTGWHVIDGCGTSGVTVNHDRTWNPQIVVRGCDYVTYWERHWDGTAWTPWAETDPPLNSEGIAGHDFGATQPEMVADPS